MNRENFLESRLEDEQKISAHMYNNGLRAFSMVREALYGCPSDATRLIAISEQQRRICTRC